MHISTLWVSLKSAYQPSTVYNHYERLMWNGCLPLLQPDLHLFFTLFFVPWKSKLVLEKTNIRQAIREKIASGKFNFGIPFLDNEYTKLILNSGETFKMCNVSARKYPLKEIWEQSANLHKDLLRLRSNQKHESMSWQHLIKWRRDYKFFMRTMRT